jgi:hypothetical protein
MQSASPLGSAKVIRKDLQGLVRENPALSAGKSRTGSARSPSGFTAESEHVCVFTNLRLLTHRSGANKDVKPLNAFKTTKRLSSFAADPSLLFCADASQPMTTQ